MTWKETLIREYAGPLHRVALNVFIVASIGILLGHGVLGAPLDENLVMGAMTPALIAIVSAAILKEKSPRRET
jgi:hypothetical protein